MAEHEVLHTYANVFFNHEAVQNKPDVTTVIITQFSVMTGLKKVGKNSRGIPHRDEVDPYKGHVFPSAYEGLDQII